MIPTRSELARWQPGELSEAARLATELAESLRGPATRLLAETGELSYSWHGIAFAAAQDRAEDESRAARRLAHAVDDLAELFTSAATREAGLAEQVHRVRSAVAAIESQGLTVTDTWALHDPDAVATENTLATEQHRLTSLVEQLDRDDTALATAIRALLPDIRANAPAGEGLTGRRGTELGGQLRAGEITPALAQAIGRDLHTAGLSPSQLEHLAAGKPILSLPTSTQAYLQNLLHQAGADGVLALHRHYAELGDEGRPHSTALANAVLLLSHENIGTGAGGDGGPTSPGGYHRLPEDMRELLSTRAGNGPDAHLAGSEATPQFYERQHGLAALLRDGTHPPGTELGVDLNRQAAMLARHLDPGERVPAPPGAEFTTPPFRTLLAETVTAYTETATRNTDASAATLTGTMPDGTPVDDYDPAATLIPLLRHDWAADGPATRLVDWIGAEAAHEDSTVRERSRSGFAALTGIVAQASGDADANNYLALMDIGGDSLGTVNPELTRALAVTVSPYLNEMVSYSSHSATPGTDTHGSRITEGNGYRFAAIVFTDDASAQAFSAAVARQQELNSIAYAQHTLATPGDAHQITSWALTNARLQNMHEYGLHAEAAHRQFHAGHTAALHTGQGTALANLAINLPLPYGVGDAVRVGYYTSALAGSGSGTTEALLDREVFQVRGGTGGTPGHLPTEHLHAMAVAAGVAADALPAELAALGDGTGALPDLGVLHGALGDDRNLTTDLHDRLVTALDERGFAASRYSLAYTSLYTPPGFSLLTAAAYHHLASGGLK